MRQKYQIWFRKRNLHKNPSPLLKHSCSCGLGHSGQGPVFHFFLRKKSENKYIEFLGKIFNTKSTQKCVTKCNVLVTAYETLLSDQSFHVVTHPSDGRCYCNCYWCYCKPTVNTLTCTLFIKIFYVSLHSVSYWRFTFLKIRCQYLEWNLQARQGFPT